MHLLLVLALVLVNVPFHGQNQATADSRAKTIAPYLDDQTIVILHASVAQMDLAALPAKIAMFTANKAEAVAKEQLMQWLSAMSKAGVRDFYAVASLADLPRPPYIIVPIPKDVNVDAVRAVFGRPALEVPHSPILQPEICEQIGEVLFAGSKAARDRLKNAKLGPRPDLARAFTAAGDTAVQVVLLANADVRRALEDTLPTLPEFVGGGSVKTLTRGITWAAIGADVTPKISVRVFVQSEDAASAKRLAEWWITMLRRVGGEKEIQQIWPNFNDLSEKLRFQVQGDHLSLALDDATFMALTQPPAIRARNAANRANNVNNLKQIGVRLHHHHDVSGTLPAAAIYDKSGKPLLSWRVQILPYIDQELYKQFKLDEPWDSEHNKKLIEKMPALYRSSPNLEPGKTTYLAVTGDKAAFAGTKGMHLKEFRDGTSYTILVVDVDESKAVPWIKPEDYAYDPANPGAGLKGRFDGLFACLFGDGHVNHISGKTDPKTLNALFTRDGGETIGNIP